MMQDIYTWSDLVGMIRDNARAASHQALERRHPGFTRMSRDKQLRVQIQDALLEDVPPPPNTLEEAVRLQRAQGRHG